MERHIFLIPGFFGFANIGDFTYWGPLRRHLDLRLREAGMSAQIHCVQSLPTSSLRARGRCLLETVASAGMGTDAIVHLIGHSTGGLDARLFLTPAVDFQTDIDAEAFARRVYSSVSIATPHRGAPIASWFARVLGGKVLQLLSLLTIASLRVGELPLSVWADVAKLFVLPSSVSSSAGSLVEQLYRQLLADFNTERREQVRALLSQVERDQSLLTQLTVETMDLFNAAAGDRDGVSYGAVVTRAKPPTLAGTLEIGIDPVSQAQHALYYNLSRLAYGYEFPAPGAEYEQRLSEAFGAVPGNDANDGIVPTLSQPWGRCIAVAQADHLDIIGHYAGDSGDAPDERHYDWLTTRSNFRTPQFVDVCTRIVNFLGEAEEARG